DRSRIRLIDAGQDFHQSRFPSSIFTDQRQNFGASDLKMNRVQSNDAGKSFSDSRHLKDSHEEKCQLKSRGPLVPGLELADTIRIVVDVALGHSQRVDESLLARGNPALVA